jgi:hypothetical protein
MELQGEGDIELLDQVGWDDVSDQVEGQETPGALQTPTYELASGTWSHAAVR